MIKYIILTILMVSMGAGAVTSLLGWQGTVFEYNAYLQGGIALLIFIWECHKLLAWQEAKHSKPITNARDKK